ncbi:MAG: hypothetical protein H6839_11900 [Planctomycetes bacterium]|nr:hypothetical protein [Planctomycetota bacterium]
METLQPYGEVALERPHPYPIKRALVQMAWIGALLAAAARLSVGTLVPPDRHMPHVTLLPYVAIAIVICWILVFISCCIAAFLLYMRAEFSRLVCSIGVLVALAVTVAILVENRHFIGF